MTLDASQKLDTYREQISLLVKTAAAWTKTMAQTWSNQQQFTQQLNECHLVMKTFDHSRQSIEPSPMNDDNNTKKKKNRNSNTINSNDNNDNNESNENRKSDNKNENNNQENNESKENKENESNKNNSSPKLKSTSKWLQNKKRNFLMDLDNTRHFSNVVKRISQELHLDVSIEYV